jgi:CRP-like cAMP-binding protein
VYDITLTDDARLLWHVNHLEADTHVMPLRWQLNAHRRVADRLLCALEMLGGKVNLSHAEIGTLITAQREAVTVALRALRNDGYVLNGYSLLELTPEGRGTARAMITGRLS